MSELKQTNPPNQPAEIEKAPCDPEYQRQITRRDRTTREPRGIERQILEYWSWFAIGIFLLTTVDMVTTVYASHVVGTHAEANPIIRWALNRGVLVLTIANLTAVILVTILFDRVVHTLRTTPSPYDRYATMGVEIWLGSLIALGLFVFANNLAVIIHTQSLIPSI